MWPDVIMSTDSTELTGKVVNGVIVLDQLGKLEDGTAVRVIPMDKISASEKAETLKDMLLSFSGAAEALQTRYGA